MATRPAPSEIDKKLFQQAMQLHQQGQSREAIRLFDQVRKSWGDDADIWYLIALAHGQLGELENVVKTSQKALAINAIHFGALCTLANAQMALGDHKNALENYRQSLAIKPDDPGVIDNYGRALGLVGKREEAIEQFMKVVNANPNYAPAHASLAKAYVEGGHPEQGFEELQKALSIDPNLGEAHIGIANIYFALGDNGAAEYHYKQALKFQPSMLHAKIGLGSILRLTGDFDGALKMLDEADQLKPNDPYLIATRADILLRKGDEDTAYELLCGMNERNQMTPLGVEAFSRLCRKFDVCDDALELIDLSIEAPVTDNMEKQMLRYAAGSLLDKLQRYDEAFEMFQAANNTIEISYDPAEQEATTEQIMACFSQQAMTKFKRAASGSTRPIFILGMTRSGSTLVEQILSSHSDVYGAGELNSIKLRLNEIRALKPGAEGYDLGHMSELSEEEMTSYARRYLDDINGLNSEAKFVTDKMPHNFLMIGLINLLFPQARIIHCRRNPLDNCLSIYFQGFLWAHNYATELKNIGHFYNEYRRLMKHWEQASDIPILHVDYEDMIEDSQAMSRKILDFCNLEWQDSVKDFHNTGRAVATASFEQVRQPIYTTSRARWKNYEQHIEPLKSALAAEYLTDIG